MFRQEKMVKQFRLAEFNKIDPSRIIAAVNEITPGKVSNVNGKTQTHESMLKTWMLHYQAKDGLALKKVPYIVTKKSRGKHGSKVSVLTLWKEGR